MLFRGEENSRLKRCSKCGADRFKRVGKALVPQKVLRYFPLIPRLQRFFSTPMQARYMTWHAPNMSRDGVMRHVRDAAQWKFVNQNFPEFGCGVRNFCLGMSTDGVNPFSMKRLTWSTWPVIITNYNIPSYMTTKRHFMILSMIIPGP